MAIDSKFPLDAFRRIESDGDEARRAFATAVKGHADSIAKKYIVPNEGTLDVALMFVPSENVYCEMLNTLDSKGQAIDAYCREKKIVAVSPNTLYANLCSSRNLATTSRTPSKATPKPTSASKKPRTPSAACSAKPPPKPPSRSPTQSKRANRFLLADHTPNLRYLVYTTFMSRTNIELDDALVHKARKLTRLKTKREIVDRALELLVRSETRKGILRFYGSGIWKGDLKATRRDRV